MRVLQGYQCAHDQPLLSWPPKRIFVYNKKTFGQLVNVRVGTSGGDSPSPVEDRACLRVVAVLPSHPVHIFPVAVAQPHHCRNQYPVSSFLVHEAPAELVLLSPQQHEYYGSGYSRRIFRSLPSFMSALLPSSVGAVK